MFSSPWTCLTASRALWSRPVGVLLRLQVGLEDRLQDQHHRHLRHAIANRADLSFILHLFATELGIEWRSLRPVRGPCLGHEADRRDQERRVGLRNRAMISGVNWIHQGPWDVGLDPVQEARLAPIRDRRYRHIEQVRRDARRAPPIRPVSIGTHDVGRSGQPLGIE